MVAVLITLVLFNVLARTSIFIPHDAGPVSTIFLAISRIGTYSFNLVTLLAMIVLAVALLLEMRIEPHDLLGDVTRILLAILVASGFLLSFGREPGTTISLAYNAGVGLVVTLMAVRAILLRVPRRELLFWGFWTAGTWLALYEPLAQLVYQAQGRLDVPAGIRYTTYWAEGLLVLAFACTWLVYWLLPVRAEGRQVDSRHGWWVSLLVATGLPLLFLGANLGLPGVVSLLTKFALGYNMGLPWPIYLISFGLLLFTLLRLALGGASVQRYTATGLLFVFAAGFQQFDSYHYTLLLLGLLVLLRARGWPQLEYTPSRVPAMT